MAVVADLWDVQKTLADLTADLRQGGQVAQDLLHPEVLGIIDRGSGAQVSVLVGVLFLPN